ncbi:hypothetical protein LRAMOSA06867 [Lichtheimia ramosa]|uniref:Nucleoside transporter n=1 Tax=Lichtheimia ramosa TaxID=688394 RepID=A0A077W940_9FUNG|nr:hypothetical protein LRAMOSA06867 [Lichtheimia ramosa]
MLQEFRANLRRLFNVTNKPESNQHEAQSLLSNRSHEHLDLYAEGEHDTHNIVYWVFFIYGIAMLLPWNVFITASEYFVKRFADTPYAETFQNYFSTSFTATNLALFGLLLWRQSNAATFRLDVLGPILVNSVVFGIMAITVATAVHGTGYFWTTMILLTITGLTTSVFQIAVFAEACRFPPRYIQAVMSGQGIAGVAVAFASLLSAFAGSTTQAPDEASITRSAFIYFMSAFAITIAALVGRIVVSRQPFYIKQSQLTTGILSTESLDDTDVEEGDSDDHHYTQQTSVAIVIRKCGGLIFAVAYVFAITLAVFPSITALIKSVVRHDPDDSQRIITDGNRFLDDDVFVAFHFVLFNVGDWVGRTLPIFPSMRTFKTKLLVLYSLARTLFVPAFLMCNVVVSDRKMAAVIDSDVIYMLLVWIFAVSNGWLGSLTMMAAPQQESITSATEKSLIGSVMSFSLLVGLAVGGSASFILRAIV